MSLNEFKVWNKMMQEEILSRVVLIVILGGKDIIKCYTIINRDYYILL